MSEKVISERDAVMRERAAFQRGYRTWRFTGRNTEDVAEIEITNPGELRRLAEATSREYPLPNVKRSRVVPDPHVEFNQAWRVTENKIEWCSWYESPTQYGPWRDLTPQAMSKTTDRPTSIQHVTSARIRLWADLLANPTEETESE